MVPMMLIGKQFFSSLANSRKIDRTLSYLKYFRSFDPKSVLTGLASNIMSRGFVGGGTTPGASQVVSLNLTNLLVLVLLKALIFAAGSIGAGTWKGGLGRSLNGEERLITDEEVILFLSYLTGMKN